MKNNQSQMADGQVGEFSPFSELDRLKVEVQDLRVQLIMAQRMILDFQYREATAAREAIVRAATEGADAAQESAQEA